MRDLPNKNLFEFIYFCFCVKSHVMSCFAYCISTFEHTRDLQGATMSWGSMPLVGSPGGKQLLGDRSN